MLKEERYNRIYWITGNKQNKINFTVICSKLQICLLYLSLLCLLYLILVYSILYIPNYDTKLIFIINIIVLQSVLLFKLFKLSELLFEGNLVIKRCKLLNKE